jgi:hypothetical protein
MRRKERMKRRRWKITKIFIGKRAIQKEEKKLKAARHKILKN